MNLSIIIHSRGNILQTNLAELMPNIETIRMTPIFGVYCIISFPVSDAKEGVTMKKVLQCSFILFILFALVFIACSCDREPTYSGKNEHLAATAIYSIPGTNSVLADKFLILEQDEFGRTMFAATLDNSYLSSSSELAFPTILAIMIVQRFDNKYVYFYGEENYLFKTLQNSPSLTNETPTHYFSDEDIQALKAANDWGNLPENNRRTSVKAPILMHKEDDMPYSTRKSLERIIGSNIKVEPFREDASGKKAYFVLRIALNAEPNETQYEWYLVVFDDNWEIEDEKVSVLHIQKTESLAEQVSAFLQQHNWTDNS